MLRREHQRARRRPRAAPCRDARAGQTAVDARSVEALLAAADRTAGFVGPELLTRAATHARDTGRTGLRERALMAMQQIVDPASVGWTHRRRRVSRARRTRRRRAHTSTRAPISRRSCGRPRPTRTPRRPTPTSRPGNAAHPPGSREHHRGRGPTTIPDEGDPDDAITEAHVHGIDCSGVLVGIQLDHIHARFMPDRTGRPQPSHTRTSCPRPRRIACRHLQLLLSGSANSTPPWVSPFPNSNRSCAGLARLAATGLSRVDAALTTAR